MTYKNPNALMSTEKLSENIDDPNIVILDGTYHLPNMTATPAMNSTMDI